MRLHQVVKDVVEIGYVFGEAASQDEIYPLLLCRCKQCWRVSLRVHRYLHRTRGVKEPQGRAKNIVVALQNSSAKMMLELLLRPLVVESDSESQQAQVRSASSVRSHLLSSRASVKMSTAYHFKSSLALIQCWNYTEENLGLKVTVKIDRRMGESRKNTTWPSGAMGKDV